MELHAVRSLPRLASSAFPERAIIAEGSRCAARPEFTPHTPVESIEVSSFMSRVESLIARTCVGYFFLPIFASVFAGRRGSVWGEIKGSFGSMRSSLSLLGTGELRFAR